MDKVRLPRSVAESINFFRELGMNDYDLMQVFANGHDDHCVDGATLLNFAEENTKVALQAIVNGYEVEQTPEDKVMELYRSYANAHSSEQYKVGYNIGARNGIIQCLDALGITIPGVNGGDAE